ncbi:MAG: DUF1254 domain-containing protein [Planctomycetia bacterium]
MVTVRRNQMMPVRRLRAVLALAATMFAAGSAVTPAATIAGAIGPSEAIRAVAREAYVWGWPLAYVHQCRTRIAMISSPGRSGGLPVAPLNELAMLTDRITPRTGFVPCPNRDVLYGFGVFDLAATPVVIQIPDFGDRFWLYQLGDQRTDGFADLGSMHGTRPGCYLVVGPGWAAAVPPGIIGVLRSPTRHAYCIPRIFFTSADGDREAAVAAAAGVLAYPLGEFTGRPQMRDWSRLKWLPSLSRDNAVVGPDRFLDILPQLLADVPPLPGEEPLYDRLRGLVAAVAADPAVGAAAAAAMHDAEREVVAPLFEFRNVGRPLPGGWTTVVNGAAFGTDYLTRTAVARSNVFVNRHRETKYYYLDVDSAGRRLHGDRRHVITFSAGSLPPAAGFWSLTAYDSRHALPADSTERHAIGSRDAALAFNGNGSLSIVIDPAGMAHEEPAGPSAGGANRITAPPGPFSLYLRLYEPGAAALDGRWPPPAGGAAQEPQAAPSADLADDTPRASIRRAGMTSTEEDR